MKKFIIFFILPFALFAGMPHNPPSYITTHHPHTESKPSQKVNSHKNTSSQTALSFSALYFAQPCHPHQYTNTHHPTSKTVKQRG